MARVFDLNNLRAGPFGFCGDGDVCFRLISTTQAPDSYTAWPFSSALVAAIHLLPTL